MKFSRFFLGLAFLAATAFRLPAQTPAPDAAADTSGALDADSAVPPGATVINSDELRMDQTGHTAVFTGNVEVLGSNFKMTCEEMTVFFTNDSKIDNIVAKGNVVIIQPGRITHCGQAQYFHDEDKFVLTDQPVILDNKTKITGPTKITIWRGQQTMKTEGGRAQTTILDSSSMTSPAKPQSQQP